MFAPGWSGGQTAIFAVLAGVAAVAILGDAYTTAVALPHGFGEKNKLEKWLFNKLGQSLTVFIEGVLVLFLGSFFASRTVFGGDLFFGIIAAGEGAQTLINYLKLRKAKISLK